MRPTPHTAQDDDTTAVRQGVTLGVMRWVLAASLAGAVVALVLVWKLA